jgi:carbamoyl-phosphate synthase small subunit
MANGYLVLESGEVFQGLWHGGRDRAGEVVFNTSHSGYEEIATDPSYYNQIMVMTAPMMGNYGAHKEHWESRKIWIEGFCCLEMNNSPSESTWRKALSENEVPILSDFDTRELVIRLRDGGTPWGALVKADSAEAAKSKAQTLISEKKKEDLDWVYAVSTREIRRVPGDLPNGPRIAVIDYGVKENTIRELKKRASEVQVFPSRSTAEQIKAFNPDGIMLSNGPGDPKDVKVAVETVKALIGWRFIYGICMGHQILAMALGAETYKLKFGHRGGNHPVKDLVLNKIYVTSQNHGYAVKSETLPAGVTVTQTNLNDGTVSGIECKTKKCMSVQYHPESHPGPHDAAGLFDYFVSHLR